MARTTVSRSRYGSISITDGIIEWFNGPEWDEVAYEQFEIAARQLEEIAKQNAIWEDRSGDAREGLTARAYNDNGVIGITLFHTVDHGLWLEIIQNGRFAIIMPTIEEESRRITYNAIRRIRYARKGEIV